MSLTKEQKNCLKGLQELARLKWVSPLLFFENLGLQKDFDESDARVKGLYGGNRSGKTEKGSEYVIRRCMNKPNQRWWACAETYKDSVDIQQRKVWKLLPKREVKYAHYNEVNGFRNEKVIFNNGSYISFKSYNQGRESFQSDDLDGIWNDEECPYDVYKEQRMRLLDRNGEMLFTMTSLKGVTDLIQDIFADHTVIRSQYAPLVDEELPRIVEKDGIKIYLLWTTENKYIDQDRVSQDVKLMTREEIKSRIYGVPVNLAGKIYMKFSTNVHVVPFENVPFSNVCIYNILDPHDRKPWAIAWIAVDKTGTAYVIDEYPDREFTEILYDDKSYTDYANLIKERESVIKQIFRKDVVKRIIDPNFGNKTIQLAERSGGTASTTPKRELAKRGLIYSDATDALEAGHLEVRQWLHYETNDGGEIVVQPKLFVADNCHNVILQMQRYSRKDIVAGDGDVRDNVKPRDKYKDFPDLVRYFCMSGGHYIERPKERHEDEGRRY